MTTDRPNPVVADGYHLNRRAARDEVRTAVWNEYRDQYRTAPWWRRIGLRVKIRQEITRRLEQAAPRAGLYAADVAGPDQPARSTPADDDPPTTPPPGR